MKYLFFLLLSPIFVTLQPYTANTALSGKITDERGEALIGAAVKVTKDASLVKGAVTDYNGQYRLEIDPGVYTVEISYTGYESRRITDVVVTEGKITTLDATLKTSGTLSEVVVISYKVPLIEQDKTSSGTTLTSESIHRMPKPSGEVRTEKTKKKSASDVRVEGRRAETAPAKPVPAVSDVSEIEAGHVAMPATTAPAEAPARKESGEPRILSRDDLTAMPKTEDEEHPSALTLTEPSPRAGLLTAGEWNDLHNWSKHWTDLLADGEIAAYQDQYKFYPQHRYAVLLQNEQELPVVDAEVKLLDPAGAVIWEARTDNLGRAELWAGMFSPGKERSSGAAQSDSKIPAGQLIAFVDGKKYNFPTTKPFSEGLNKLKIKRECRAPKNVDIVWAVDATGSMGDEIEYLKTEVLDVIGRVQGNNPELSIRMGTVFYRDQGDDYLVKSSGLSPDIRQTVDYIGQQFAGGGGDYPEAVHSALEEAVYRQAWSADAVARICFLVLDASPHQDPAVIESLQKSIREAARKGIRIVPVSASGIQKDTEFLMKFFGLATNGSYVFLTDHSGIGGKHLEPTTDEYKVELLNDLLVRLITEYSTVENCDGKSAIRFDDPQNQQQQQPDWQAFYYPNPASDQFTLELPCTVQSVTLYDAEGKAVHKLEKPQEGRNTVLVSDLPEGFYTIRILKDGRMQSGKLMVVRG